jgi:hypothetical protein
LFRNARLAFGRARLQLGMLLATIRAHSLWKGKAESFGAFLASENIDDNAARQYMRVAQKFITDLRLSDGELDQIAMTSFRALDKASRVITPANKDEVLSVLANLAGRDAVEQIINMSAGVRPEGEIVSLRVIRLLADYHYLPPDLQQQFMDRLERVQRARRESNPSDVRTDSVPRP